ncbi:hypothetical protein Tco_1498916 [Tanacetum coccineum]
MHLIQLCHGSVSGTNIQLDWRWTGNRTPTYRMGCHKLVDQIAGYRCSSLNMQIRARAREADSFWGIPPATNVFSEAHMFKDLVFNASYWRTTTSDERMGGLRLYICRICITIYYLGL